MPAEASLAKVAAVKGFGGTVRLGGDSVDACVASARERAAETGATFVHPFDDPEIVAGQGTLGLELLDDVEDIATVVVPVGGGGLISGVAGVLKAARPGVRVIGVQVESCSAYVTSLERGEPVEVGGGPTLADGIAIKRPGRARAAARAGVGRRARRRRRRTTSPRRWSCCSSAPSWWSRAPARSASPRCSSGAIVPAARGSTVVLLSGGNVDAGVLATVALRHETAEGRRLRFFTRVEDRPGGLARLLTCIAEAGGNLVTVTHVREAVPLHVRQTGVDLVLETRGAEHAAEIVAALEQAGYGIERPADGAFGRPAASAGDRLEPPRRRRRAPAGRHDRRDGTDARTRAAFALAELLRRPRFEIIPLDGIEEQVLAHLGTDVKVTVTASPRKGLEATLELSERLARAGYPVVPHLSARLVRDRSHLEEIVDAAARGRSARAVRPRRRRGRAGRVRRRRRAVARDGPAARALRRDRHHRLPRDAPPDLRRGDDPGDVRQGADGDVHHQPDLLRRRRDRRLDRRGPAPRHRAADLDRAARARSTTRSCSGSR